MSSSHPHAGRMGGGWKGTISMKTTMDGTVSTVTDHDEKIMRI